MSVTLSRFFTSRTDTIFGERTNHRSNLPIIPQDLIQHCFNFLDFPEHAVVARCCRNWHYLIGRNTIYLNVLIKAGIPDIQVKCLHDYLKEDNLKVMVTLARELFNLEDSYKVNYKFIDRLAHEVLKSSRESSPERILAGFLRGRLRVNNLVTSLTDKHAFNLLIEVARQDHMFPDMAAEAKNCIIKLRILQRIAGISGPEAYEQLNAIIHNNQVLVETRVGACITLAYLEIHRHTNFFTDEALFDLLDEIDRDPEVSLKRRLIAQLLKVSLRISNRTDFLTDENATSLLNDIIGKVRVHSHIYAKAYLYLMRLRAQHRTNSLTDEEAYIILNSIIKDPNSKKDIVKQAKKCMSQLPKPHKISFFFRKWNYLKVRNSE